jgi:hypothetical protein
MDQQPEYVLGQLEIPAIGEPTRISLVSGQSTIFLGANGAGKTRLGVYIETALPSDVVRRISAHRSLVMSDKLQSISLDRALRALEHGYPDAGGQRLGHRWSNDPAVAMLSDYDYVVQALFADQGRVAVDHLMKHHNDSTTIPPVTLTHRLKNIWERLLPHRRLCLLELGVEVIPATNADAGYSGSQMSDGERVIFYLVGHCLLAPKNSVMIIDEPELHIHKAILGRLWDAIESERPDVSFVYITHDLDFAVTRPTARKFVVKSFLPTTWEIEQVPPDTEIPDRIVFELMGSRQPVLFVEGDRGSVDATIYRGVYTDFLVQSIGSCEDVIHAVGSFRRNRQLAKIGDVFGLIDSDGRPNSSVESLNALGVHVLPVMEIENILLLPHVFAEIARSLQFLDKNVIDMVDNLSTELAACAGNEVDQATARHAARRLDEELKRLAPVARNLDDLDRNFKLAVEKVDLRGVAASYRDALVEAIHGKDTAKLLSLYDSKGLLSIGARLLGFKGRNALTEYVGRLLSSPIQNSVLEAIRKSLPALSRGGTPGTALQLVTSANERC